MTGAAPGSQPRNPLHGVTLETILRELVDRHGWEWLGRHVEIRCFTTDPSIPSALRFLRRTPWARSKVEDLYVHGPETVQERRSRKNPRKAR